MKFTFSPQFFYEIHIFLDFFLLFCFVLNFWEICVLFTIIYENFHDLSANFLFISWSLIKILFFSCTPLLKFSFISRSSLKIAAFLGFFDKINILSVILWRNSHFVCDLLKNLHFDCYPLTKFAFCTKFFDEICILFMILCWNSHFFSAIIC